MKKSLADRFYKKVYIDPDSGCWEWTGTIHHQTGSDNNSSKLDESDVLEIRGLLSMGYSLSSLSRLYGVSVPVIFNIKHHNNWTYI